MRYLSLFIILFSINSFAITCADDEIDLNPGDVISADMVKDIFDRISGKLTPDELDGIWSCTSYTRNSGTANGYSIDSNGLGSSMTQDVTFSKQSNGTFIVTYENHLSDSSSSVSGPMQCSGKFMDNASFGMFGSVPPCFNGGIFSMRKVSKACFVWDVRTSNGGASTSCQKKSLVPLAPTDLTATLSGSSVSLSWTSGDSSTVSYTLKAKTSNTGTYSNLITENNGTTYTDTLSTGTKWYRIYGVNASGTSTGSNVVSVTAP